MSSLSHTAYYRDDATIVSRLTLIPDLGALHFAGSLFSQLTHCLALIPCSSK